MCCCRVHTETRNDSSATFMWVFNACLIKSTIDLHFLGRSSLGTCVFVMVWWYSVKIPWPGTRNCTHHLTLKAVDDGVRAPSPPVCTVGIPLFPQDNFSPWMTHVPLQMDPVRPPIPIHIQVSLRDFAGSVPDHCHKSSITIRQGVILLVEGLSFNWSKAHLWSTIKWDMPVVNYLWD